MGEKITIDSASMMNKGLEVIEAKWLFDVEMKHIDVLVHPQSIVHSLVELRDGTCLAQLGVPDMKTPIAYALTYPDRMTNNLPRLDLSTIGKLEFIAPDFKKFPCLRLAYEAGSCGGTVPAVLNASDEVAVAAFIRGTIGFTDLAVIIEETLSLHNRIDRPSLSDIIESDRWARKVTEKIIKRMKR
jgi:1-deoxy-D-xylulose-5-phosphate reductoisomerase